MGGARYSGRSAPLPNQTIWAVLWSHPVSARARGLISGYLKPGAFGMGKTPGRRGGPVPAPFFWPPGKPPKPLRFLVRWEPKDFPGAGVWGGNGVFSAGDCFGRKAVQTPIKTFPGGRCTSGPPILPASGSLGESGGGHLSQSAEGCLRGGRRAAIQGMWRPAGWPAWGPAQPSGGGTRFFAPGKRGPGRPLGVPPLGPPFLCTRRLAGGGLPRKVAIFFLNKKLEGGICAGPEGISGGGPTGNGHRGPKRLARGRGGFNGERQVQGRGFGRQKNKPFPLGAGGRRGDRAYGFEIVGAAGKETNGPFGELAWHFTPPGANNAPAAFCCGWGATCLLIYATGLQGPQRGT